MSTSRSTNVHSSLARRRSTRSSNAAECSAKLGDGQIMSAKVRLKRHRQPDRLTQLLARSDGPHSAYLDAGVMPADRAPRRDPAEAIAARDRGLQRLRGLRRGAAALALALVAGFAVLAGSATHASNPNSSAGTSTGQASSSDSSSQTSGTQSSGNGDSWSDYYSTPGDSSSSSGDDSSSQDYTAPTPSDQSPSAVSGGS
jgi:hypothetical protein